MTFTELEMQINLIQDNDEDMRAQLNEMIVPEVPMVGDMISGCSLNTEKMYMKYNKMLHTSANKNNTNGNIIITAPSIEEERDDDLL